MSPHYHVATKKEINASKIYSLVGNLAERAKQFCYTVITCKKSHQKCKNSVQSYRLNENTRCMPSLKKPTVTVILHRTAVFRN